MSVEGGITKATFRDPKTVALVSGIGYYSLSKMGRLLPFAVSRGWLSWGLWTLGLTLRWIANVNLWYWRALLPISGGIELAAFLIFFRTVSGHRRKESGGGMETWMKIVVASTIGFLLLLLTNFGTTVYLALAADGPNIPHWFDQRYLVLATWGFPVLAVWGFNARWLPVFLGLQPPSGRGLVAALSLCAAGVLATFCGYFPLAAGLLVVASSVAIVSLNMFQPSQHPPKTQGVHPSFPWFVRVCYIWLLAASVLSLWAATADRNGGIWGVSPCPHCGLSGWHDLRDRSKSVAGLLRDAAAVQQPVDVRVAATVEHRLSAASIVRDPCL